MSATRSVIQQIIEIDTHDTFSEQAPPVAEPELARQIESESRVLDNWIAFRVSPYFTERIYSGESLEVNAAALYTDVIAPHYKREQFNYLDESMHMVNSQIPAKQDALERAQRRLSFVEDELAVSMSLGGSGIEVDNDGISAKALMCQQEAARQQLQVRELAIDLHNIELRAKTKEQIFLSINELLHNASPEEQREKSEVIIAEAKKIALRQAIIALETDGTTRPRLLNRRKRALQKELEALCALH